MIFVTTGAQEPFDRLIKAMDEVAPKLKGMSVLAQFSSDHYTAKNLGNLGFISPSKFDEYFGQADLIVGHAGMGTIISSLMQKKPIIVMPRLAKYGETRNDHQLATAREFEKLGFIHVAYHEEELESKLFSIIGKENACSSSLGKYASPRLITSIRTFLDE